VVQVQYCLSESGDVLSEKHLVIEQDTLEQNDMEEPQGRGAKIIMEFFHVFYYLILVFLVSYIIIHFVGQRTQVQGQSMENSLSNQDSLILEKLSYNFFYQKRYDIIVFPVDASEDVYYIKRIIGMPGETVQILDGEVYINDALLEENYGKEKIAEDNEGLATLPILLGEEEYFVLGDNRNHSTDSRNPLVGNVTNSSIVGKAWIRIWPIDHFGFLKHQK
jgi:signal peptidase I